MALWNDKEDAIEVDLDYKRVIIPNKYKKIAVAGDNVSDIIPYRLPTNFRGFNLSTSTGEIIWVRPDGLKRISSLNKVETNAEFTWFAWTIPALAAALDGEIEVQLVFTNGDVVLNSPIMNNEILSTLYEVNISDDSGIVIPPSSGGSSSVNIDTTNVDRILS